MTAKKANRRARPRHDWSDLVLLLRHYKPADATPTWEHDFKVEVEKIVAIFADKETPLVAWLPAITVIAVEILTKATPSQLESFLEHLSYLPIGRSGDLPLPAQTRERLAKVRDDAAQLAGSLQAAIVDPLMLALELLRDHGLEKLLRLSEVTEGLQKPSGGEVAPAAGIRSRMAEAERLHDLECLKRLARLAEFDEALGADALGKPVKLRVPRGNHGQGLLHESHGARGVMVYVEMRHLNQGAGDERPCSLFFVERPALSEDRERLGDLALVGREGRPHREPATPDERSA